MRSTPSETRSRRKSSAKRKTPSAVFTGERRECVCASRLTRCFINERAEANTCWREIDDRERKVQKNIANTRNISIDAAVKKCLI